MQESTYKKSKSLDKEYFVKPRIIFDEAFEARVASGVPSTRLGKYIEKLKSGRYVSYVEFALKYKYAFSYGMVGVLIFGLIVGLLCAGFGLSVDSILKKIKIHNDVCAKNSEQYRKHKHAFFVQDYQMLIIDLIAYAIKIIFLYSLLLFLAGFIRTLNPILELWYDLFNTLSIKMASFVPAVAIVKEYLTIQEPASLARSMHVLSLSWLIAALPLPMFLNYSLYLIITRNSWDDNNHFAGRFANIKFLLIFMYAILFSFVGTYITFRQFYLGNINVGLIEHRPTMSSVGSFLFVFFIIASFACVIKIYLSISNQLRRLAK